MGLPHIQPYLGGFSIIAGARALLLGEDVPVSHSDLTWTVVDLYRGITPTIPFRGWDSLFATPESIAQSDVYKLVRYPAQHPPS